MITGRNPKNNSQKRQNYITINSDTNYADIYDRIKTLYLSKFDIQNLPSIPTYDKHLKTNTPLIYAEDLNDLILETYQKALLYIGKCHSEVPGNRDRVCMANFNNTINYGTREFGYIPKAMQFSYQKLIEIAFSASGFRLMCVKAEIAVYLYFKILSKIIETGTDECLTENDKVFLGGVTYAIDMSLKHGNENIRMAVYVWELTTLMNVFGDLDLEFERLYCIPSHHVFQSVHRYNNITYFGEYNEYLNDERQSLRTSSEPNDETNDPQSESKTEVQLETKTSDNICESEATNPSETPNKNIDSNFWEHISRVPRCSTEIEFNPTNRFYNGIDLCTSEGYKMFDVKDCCTRCFNTHFEAADKETDLKFKARELLKICSYEERYLLNPGETYEPNSWEVIKDPNVFKNLVKVPETFKNKVYLVLNMASGLQVYEL